MPLPVDHSSPGAQAVKVEFTSVGSYFLRASRSFSLKIKRLEIAGSFTACFKIILRSHNHPLQIFNFGERYW